MGISVGVAFSFQTGDFTIHLDDNMADLWEMLVNATLVTGFNVLTFDIPLLKAEMANLIKRLTPDDQPGWAARRATMMEKLDAQHAAIEAKTYDMYPVAKAGAGADTYDKGYRVDDLLRATWGFTAAKTGNGAFAPDLFKVGKIGELISYCVADVQRERRLFERCWYSARLRAMGFKKGAEAFQVRRPQMMLGAPEGAVGILPFRLDDDSPDPLTIAPYEPVADKAAQSLASEEI